MDKLFICDYCAMKFNSKAYLRRHLTRVHMPKTVELTCYKCNITFKNNKGLVTHMDKFHKIKRTRRSNPQPKSPEFCYACKIKFPSLRELKFHIREFHFNLLSKVPYLNFKKVNQVWFENVANSKNVVEIKKVAENTILIKKLDDNTNLKVGEQSTEILDLRQMYPFKRSETIQCNICLKVYDREYYSKHWADVHSLIESKLIE